jgi:hypothetical protein
MNSRNPESARPLIPAETEYLISDVEELVNHNIGEYLNKQPFRMKIVDYSPGMQTIRGIPHLPIGITRLDRDVVQAIAPGAREFTGMDLLFSFPMTATPADENPLNVTLKWSSDINARLAIVDKRPIMLVEYGNDSECLLHASSLPPEQMKTYLESIGLPDSIWGNDFRALLRDIHSSRDVKFTRHSTETLDIGTTLDISHEAHYMKNDRGDTELIQELCLNIDHHTIGRIDGPRLTGAPSFRNMFRFDRNTNEDAWQYRGAYASKLVAGELVDELVQQDPKLGVPGSKLLEKALTFLSSKKPKQESP